MNNTDQLSKPLWISVGDRITYQVNSTDMTPCSICDSPRHGVVMGDKSPRKPLWLCGSHWNDYLLGDGNADWWELIMLVKEAEDDTC